MTRRGTILTLLAALVLLCTAPPARADLMENLAKTSPQERADIQTAFMKRKLGLSPEEAAKVEATNLEFAQKAEPVIKGSDGPFMKMREMKSIQSQKDTALQGILTPAQFATYQASQDEMKQKFEEEIAKKAAGGS
jgi:hypothetical protein